MRIANSLAAVCGIAFITAALPAQAAIRTESAGYIIEGAPYEGYLAFDDAGRGKRPGVLVFPAWKGISNNERLHAQRLAKLGYIVLVADIYGKGVHPATNAQAAAESGKYMKDRGLYRAHARAAYDLLRANPMVDPDRIAAIGYCFGGVGALELARSGSDIKDVVGFHVSNLTTPAPADDRNIKAHVLIMQGDLDPNTPPDMRVIFEKNMEDAHVDWQLAVYSGTAHCYTDAEAGNNLKHGCAYNPVAERRSWQAMNDLFHATLR
ncbi:MAG: dienelactone hydrolase family protein [Rhizomicrobium sp.]